MNSRLQLLGLIALAQLVILGLFLLSDGDARSDGGPWITLDTALIHQIRVSDGEGDLVLSNDDDQGWRIEDLPADGDKIENILNKLGDLEAPWPVATTDDAIGRFEVGDESYQRRVVIRDTNDTLVDLYLGTSPGYQRVHARKSGESDVFSVALSNFEFPVNLDGWLDKALLTAEEEPTLITTTLASGKTVLKKSDEGWLINGEAADQDAATTYANRFKTLRVLGVYTGGKALESLGTINVNEPSVLQIEILRESVALETDGAEGEEQPEGEYVARSERFDRDFRLSTYIAEQLLLTDIMLAAKPAAERDAPAEKTEAPALERETPAAEAEAPAA